MKKLLKQTLSVLTAISLIGTINFTVIADETPAESEYDLVEYDYVNKTERIISADEIFDYSATTTTTYELDSMSAYVAEMEQTVSPRLIIDPNGVYERTSPTDENGDPVGPYSGVVYLMIGIDYTNDGITDYLDAGRGTGFMVGPDVMMTAAHCVYGDGSSDYPITSVRVYPLHHAYMQPSHRYPDVYEFVYPDHWVTSTAFLEAIADGDKATASQFDWCVMKLQEPLTGLYNFACTYNSNSLVGSEVRISGYPGCPDIVCAACDDNNKDTICDNSNAFQISSVGTVSYMDNRVIRHNCNVRTGHSGGPIYNPDTFECYAVHSLSHGLTGNANSYTQGALITQFIYNVIAEYIAD